jgi:hypothetical protein
MQQREQGGADLPRYGQEQFEGDKPPCDLIMKGGITSGVVYPFAIIELARRHRFVSIGGTSAGAIAAGIAAAAEFGRDDGGFLRVAEIPEDVSRRLLSLFQPAPRYRAVFRTFLAALGDRSGTRKVLALVGSRSPTTGRRVSPGSSRARCWSCTASATAWAGPCGPSRR